MKPNPLTTLPLLPAALLLCHVAIAQSTLPPTAPTDASATVALSLFTPPGPKAPKQIAAAYSAKPIAQPPTPQSAPEPFASSSRMREQHPANGDTLHILAGQSLILHNDTPMKRVYVGNPLVLSSFNSSPTEILLTAKAPGVTSLAVWDSSGKNQLYTVSVDVDPSQIQRALDNWYPGMGLTATGVAEYLVVNGALPTQEAVEALNKSLEKYTKTYVNGVGVEPVRPKQVELKLQIIEVDRTKLDQFAINFARIGRTFAQTGTGAFNSPLNLTIGWLKESMELDIQALAQQSVLQILAEPTLTTLSGGTAKFLSGGEFPIPVVQGTATSGGSPTVTIQFRPYGVKVDFLPQINPDGSIRLKVAPEVSTLDYANAVTISGFTIPALSTRRADTEIELKDGQSFVLSGLLDHRTIENLGRVPGISRVPILGDFFKSRNNTHSITELVFVVTANIIDPLTGQKPTAQPKNVSPFITEEQFDDEVHRKQTSNPNHR